MISILGINQNEIQYLKHFMLLCILSVTISLSAVIDIDIPTVNVNTNESFEIPITKVGSATEDIFSIYVKIHFDSSVLSVNNVSTDMCLTENWEEPSYSTLQDSILVISVFGTVALADNGNLFFIEFGVISQSNSNSIISFMDFMFNEGTPDANLSNGEIIVTHRVPSIDPIEDIVVEEGDLVDFNINAIDPFGLPVIFSAIDLPEGATFEEVSSGTAQFQWQTTFVSAGEYFVGFSVTNTESFSDTVYTNIVVDNVLDISLPIIENPIETNIMIPINTNELGDQNIFSFYTKILYDSQVLTPLDVSTTGTICENWGSLSFNMDTSGEILISMFGTEELTGSGNLIDIEFNVIGLDESFSYLDFDFFIFNEGEPETSLTNGALYLGIPYADFSAIVTEGYTPFSVEFSDQSVSGTNVISDWLWSFGDGQTSTLQNPIHTYTEEGVYTVSLTIYTDVSSDETTIIDYITVNNSPPTVINPINDFAFDEDTIDYSIDLNSVFFDFDEDELIFNFYGGDSISVSISEGLVTLIPEENWFGSETIIFTAIESSGREVISDTVQVSVISVNDPPIVISPLPNIILEMNQNHTTIELTEVFYDIETSTLDYTIENQNNLVAILNPDKTVTITPETGWSGSETIFINAIDDDGGSITDFVNITVTNPFQITENFDENGAIPEGWTTHHFGSTNDPWHIEQQAGEDYCWDVSCSFLQDANERLVSPFYDLSNYSDISLSFFSEFQPNSVYSATIEISINGITWNTIASLTEATNETLSFDVSSIANRESVVQFRWIFLTSDFTNNFWKIDDFAISGVYDFSTPPTKISDLTLADNDLVSVSLNWSSTTDDNFLQYEVYYSMDDSVTIEDSVWCVEEDENLANIETEFTTITGLSPNTQYWFAIRGVDSYGNYAELSNVVTAMLAIPPSASTPFPNQNTLELNNSRLVEIGISFVDDYLVDASSIQYRIDNNGDGIYNASEPWTDVTQVRYADADSILIREFVSYNSDGDSLKFEFRATDTVSNVYCYSGSFNNEGIADDYRIRIDTTPPSVISDFDIDNAGQNSVSLSWSPTFEQNFSHYEIYYNNHTYIDTTDILWSVIQDSNLSNINTNVTQITGLSSDETYYFRIRGIDECGLVAELSNEIASIGHNIIPICYDGFPENQPNPEFANDFTVEIGCTFFDYYGIDISSVQYRFDKNGDKIYNDEGWLNYSSSTRQSGKMSRSENDTLIVRQTVTYEVEADTLHFEFRAWDVDSYGPIYSGYANAIGISDDWFVKIDVTPPTDITTIATTSPGVTSLGVGWYVSSDSNFSHYELFYDTNSLVDTSDAIWSYNNDPNLSNLGTGFVLTYVTDLLPATTYYFRVRAVDQACNASALSPTANGTTLVNSFAPLAPQNVSIEISNNDVLLSWDPVTHNTNGEEIAVSSYRIYWGDSPNISVVNFEAEVTEPNYTHINGGLAEKVFYRISAVNSNVTFQIGQSIIFDDLDLK